MNRRALIAVATLVAVAGISASADPGYSSWPKPAKNAVIAFEVTLPPRDATSSASVALLVMTDGMVSCDTWGDELCKRLMLRMSPGTPKPAEAPNTCLVVTDTDPARPGFAQFLPAAAIHLAQRDRTWHGTLYETASAKYLLAFVVDGDQVSGSADWRSTDPQKSFRKAVKGRVLRDLTLVQCVARAEDATQNYLRAAH